MSQDPFIQLSESLVVFRNLPGIAIDSLMAATDSLVDPAINQFNARQYRIFEAPPTNSSRVNALLGNPVYLVTTISDETENASTIIVSKQSHANIAKFLEQRPNGDILEVFRGQINPLRQRFKANDVRQAAEDFSEILKSAGVILSEGAVNETIAAMPKPSISEELAERFDAIVEMGEQITLEKGQSVATDTLRSCIGTFIDNPTTNTFSHYLPSQAHIELVKMLKENVTAETRKVHFMAPGEIQTDMEGKQSVVFNSQYTQDLRKSVAEIQALGVECVFHCYEKLHTDAQKNDPANRYKGTSWVTQEGALFLDGVQVAGNQPAELVVAQQATSKAVSVTTRPAVVCKS